jgi:nucleotide-binding universal stress UspA family protein
MDFSSASAAALNHALTLAQQSGGRITLLHVLEGYPYETVYSGARAMRLIEEYDVRVEKTTRELRRLVPPDAYNWCEVETTVESGVAHRSILAKATEIQADLIVMGLPDRSTFNRVVMGSTTTPVLRRAKCPVLIVPSNRADQRTVPDDWGPAVEDAHSGFLVRPDEGDVSARIG